MRSISSAVGVRPSFPRLRACPGAATSTPTTTSGSLARTTKSPSCETLKLKFRASGIVGTVGTVVVFVVVAPSPLAGASRERNGFLPFVRLIVTSACGTPVTRWHAMR